MKIDKTLTPEERYSTLPESERILAMILRDLILETLPGAREKLSWGAPFYFNRRAFCYVWPASIPWGKVTEGVAIGFQRARLLHHQGYLGQQKNDAQIGRRVFQSPEEIDVRRIRRLLRRAWELAE